MSLGSPIQMLFWDVLGIKKHVNKNNLVRNERAELPAVSILRVKTRVPVAPGFDSIPPQLSSHPKDFHLGNTTVMHFSRPPNSNPNKDRKDIHRVAIPILLQSGYY